MNRTARVLSGIVLGVVISVSAQAKEKQIKQADLPPAVLQTAEQHTTGATVTRYTKDKVEGVVVYQMDLLVDGRTRGILIAPDGMLVSVEQEIAWDQLPADVQTDLTNVAGKGKYGVVSSVTKEGKLVAYEAELDTNGKKAHVSVKPKAVTLEAIPETTNPKT